MPLAATTRRSTTTTTRRSHDHGSDDHDGRDHDDGSPPAGKPYGGQVIIGADQEPPTLNTYLPGGDNFIVAIVAQTYWVGVQEIDGFTLELMPDLVTELPTVENGGIIVNADGTETIKYTIRDEASGRTAPRFRVTTTSSPTRRS